MQLADDPGAPGRPRRRRDRRRAQAVGRARAVARARAPRAGGAVPDTRALASRQGELQRSIETAAQQVQTNTQAGEQLTLELDSASTTRPRKHGSAGRAGDPRHARGRAGRRCAPSTTTCPMQLRKRRRAAPRVRTQPAAAARLHHQAAAGRAGRAAGRRAVPGAARRRPRSTWKLLGKGIEDRRRQAARPADGDRPHRPRHRTRSAPSTWPRSTNWSPRASARPSSMRRPPTSTTPSARWKARSTRSTSRRATC